MSFPVVDRVIYQKNPLVEVVCQLSVHPQLRVETELPTDFQSHLKEKYPILHEGTASLTTIDSSQAAASGSQLSQQIFKFYDFFSKDGTWKVSLSKDFIALTTTKYQNWEDFSSRLQEVLTIYNEIYDPRIFKRVGLRYKDVIQRSTIDLVDTPWHEIIASSIAGPFADDGFSKAKHYSSSFLLPLKDTFGSVLVQYGIVEYATTAEECFLIDADYFIEQDVEYHVAITTLTSFNKKAGSLFRHCITDKLHRALDPIPK
ncbi:TIGR04255 family protein [Microvirgula aerodenitrificans]|uniref:TIGR04255 family protein n=1 Tax=Microvirgula aerodenitrificans TaxID=57480 RepID=UPI00146FA42B|nr:TIGR04255 family protein [Microvirgula aerodenitrificans]